MMDVMGLYTRLCDAVDEAGAVDTFIGRPEVLRAKLVAMRDEIGAARNCQIPMDGPGPVTQQWVHGISMMQQSVLLAAVRGPDGLAKYGGGAKMLLRWYRRCILLSAMDKRVLADPIEPNGGSFTGPSLDGPDDIDHWSERMQVHVNDYLRQLDALPHHWQMHFMHAVEIVGYKHPDHGIRHFWHQVYLRLVHDMHVWPETEEQLDGRLGDSRSGWLNRADPATTA